MKSTTTPLHDLAQRISQQEAELARLRQELTTRQTQQTALLRRQEELTAQLQQVEAELQAVAGGTSPVPLATAAVQGRSLPEFLLDVLRQAGRPLTNKELVQAVIQHAYPTTSKDIPRMVGTRVAELLQKGTLRRAGQGGVLLAAAPTARGTTSNGAGTTLPTSPRGSATATPLVLPDLLLQLLAGSTGPKKARELAEQALACGYQTQSQSFTNVVWAALAKMPQVQNVPGQGYRLKKVKAARK